MEISINEIRAYIHCPYYYRFRYPKNTPLLKIRAKEHLTNCLKATIIDFMRAWKNNGQPFTLQALQAIWNKIWYEDPIALEYTDKYKQTKNSLGNEGWLILTKFYKLATEGGTHIAAIEESFRLEITKGHYLTGTIDILLHTDDPKISSNYLAIKLADSQYNATNMVGHNDIEMTAWRRAVRKFMLRDERSASLVEPKLAYFVLDSDSREPLIETKRYNEQNEILDETVLAIIKSIQTANYYPHFGNWCHGCDYKAICNKGKWIAETVPPSFTRRKII